MEANISAGCAACVRTRCVFLFLKIMNCVKVDGGKAAVVVVAVGGCERDVWCGEN